MNVVFFENKALIILQSLVWRRWRRLSEVQMSSLQPTVPVRPAAAVGSAGVFFQRRRWASAAHRVMYGQCVGWKSSLFSSSGPPNMRQKRDNWQRFHSRCLCYNAAYGILSQSLLPRNERFPCDMWKPVKQTWFELSKNGFLRLCCSRKSWSRKRAHTEL